ncbi:hypothetical protein [Aureimonas psammosilenae]|uniref:hypothetical protein n=1 Tax=Aureimonas psammosilenae TaxID=2495496 RepID=UPI0012610ECF|nr:hypothetical protein [Aureimonas psammosilenae]
MRLIDLTLPLLAIVATSPAGAGQALYREPQPVRVAVVIPSAPMPAPVVKTYEKKCSFSVVKLPAGTYESGILLSFQVTQLWGDTNGQSNRTLYAHVADNCVAAGRSLGYRYSWQTTTAAKFASAIAATGRASATVEGDRLRVVVTAPIWLAGEVGEGIPLTRVQ